MTGQSPIVVAAAAALMSPRICSAPGRGASPAADSAGPLRCSVCTSARAGLPTVGLRARGPVAARPAFCIDLGRSATTSSAPTFPSGRSLCGSPTLRRT